MQAKKLKYKEYLEKYKNCPTSDFIEVERDAFRWTGTDVSLEDFIPVNIKRKPPARILDDSDKMCMAYGLSMFDTLNNALKKYFKLYKKQRIHQQEHFKQDKGTKIAMINLTKNDGIADLPNKNNFGHFTFHEYKETNLVGKISDLYSVFKSNGDFNI